MTWKDFFVPVRSMDEEEARACMKGHKEGPYTHLASLGRLMEAGAT